MRGICLNLARNPWIRLQVPPPQCMRAAPGLRLRTAKAEGPKQRQILHFHHESTMEWDLTAQPGHTMKRRKEAAPLHFPSAQHTLQGNSLPRASPGLPEPLHSTHCLTTQHTGDTHRAQGSEQGLHRHNLTSRAEHGLEESLAISKDRIRAPCPAPHCSTERQQLFCTARAA